MMAHKKKLKIFLNTSLIVKQLYWQYQILKISTKQISLDLYCFNRNYVNYLIVIELLDKI